MKEQPTIPSLFARAVPGIQRGCGYRVEGGVYLETGLARAGSGVPLEAFLCDPPIPFTVDHKLGIDMVERCGVWHLVDWIGEEHYPRPSDFLDEVRMYGLSRRASRTLRFDLLTAESRLIVVHAKGYLRNASAYRRAINSGADSRCRKHTIDGDDFHLRHPDTMCSRHLWIDYDNVVTTDGARMTRERSSIEYDVWPLVSSRRTTFPEPEWESAIVAMFPITRITVIRATDGSHELTLDRLRRQVSHIPVDPEDA